MNRQNTILLILAFCVLPLIAAAREVSLTLDEAIVMARTRSVSSAVALDELRTAYWEWRT